MLRYPLIFLLMIAAFPLFAQNSVAPRDSPPVIAAYPTVETHRIRILNVQGGAIEVSDDRGATWALVGRVMIPATDCLMGYLASGYSQPGTVSATAVHGLRIRVGALGSAYPKLINVLPVEFVKTPDFFGGHIAGASGIYTNIAAGTSIFRELAPHAGDPAYVRVDDSSDIPIPVDYKPKVGDIFTVVVNKPQVGLREVDFENRTGGAVKVVYDDGTVKTVCSVLKPVTGVGRFDGTSYSGVGALNTNHTGVITVSTAPVSASPLLEGDGPERRGGFQIEPAYHNSQSDEAWAHIIMVIGHPNKTRQPDLEGTPPLFHGYFDLSWLPDDPDHSWIAQMRTKATGGKWLPMREEVGFKPFVLRDVTAIRLIRKSEPDDAWIRKRILTDAQNYAQQRLNVARDGQIGVRRGKLIMKLQQSPHASFAALYVDGQLKTLTNAAPFDLTWDTTDSPDGEYLVEAKTVDASGKTVASIHKIIWVDNRKRVPDSLVLKG